MNVKGFLSVININLTLVVQPCLRSKVLRTYAFKTRPNPLSQVFCPLKGHWCRSTARGSVSVRKNAFVSKEINALHLPTLVHIEIQKTNE